MLILTRKNSEMIHIGEGIVIKVIQTGRNSVKIGIEAPSDVRILRSELQETPPKGLTLADRIQLRKHQMELTPAGAGME